jgi:eukaryotic-like serine/threonine-protein kinase
VTRKINNIELVHPINSGGTAIVYWGVDLFTGKAVAVKELRAGLFKNEFVKQKFIEEANQYLYLDHPNIVQLIDFIITDDNYYLVMEFVEGKNLFDYMTTVTGPLPMQNVALLLNEVLSALNYIHKKGLIHLDVKPSNIMLSSDDRIKLIDFGIAQNVSLQRMEKAMGSPAYMSPEQIEGKNVNNQTDIYSVGIAMYELLTGKLPFHNCTTKEEVFYTIENYELPWLQPIHEMDFQFEKEINHIFKKATNKNLNSRYKTCEEFQLDIIQFL